MSSAPPPLADYPYIHWEEVHFRDLDALGHVNNAVYAGWLESARLRYYMQLMELPLSELGLILAEMTISYKAPAFFGERIAVGVRVAAIGTRSFTMDYLLVRDGDSALIASAKTVQVCFDYKLGTTTQVPERFRALVGG
jgi:acyl-CoA thioester hydrolase